MTPNSPLPTEAAALPLIRTVGLTGMLVTFGDRLSNDANRAALAFRDAVDAARIDGVAETSTSLVSAFVLFDPSRLPRKTLESRLRGLIASRDWFGSRQAASQRLWRIKVSFDSDHAPHLEEIADLVGQSPEAAINQLLATRVRVMTIGFAPGQPYLGTLPPNWDFPRLSDLTPQVPAGSLVVALRQLVLFTNDAPTGWRQIGQTAFRTFDPASDTPFRLRTGDESSSGSIGRAWSVVLPTRRATMLPNWWKRPDACASHSSCRAGAERSGSGPAGVACLRFVLWRRGGPHGFI